MSGTKKQRETDPEEIREMPQGLVEQTGYCRFCGQTGIVRTMQGWNEERINEDVTLNCQCEAAQSYSKAVARKQKAKQRVNELFGGKGRKAFKK